MDAQVEHRQQRKSKPNYRHDVTCPGCRHTVDMQYIGGGYQECPACGYRNERVRVKR